MVLGFFGSQPLDGLVNVGIEDFTLSFDGLKPGLLEGFEKALGAALGDDLDAPVDPSAPMRWTLASSDGSDPALPAGVEPLAAHVQAPPELARRLRQIGVVPKERGAELVPQLKTGQRLVSPEGDV